jgi:hypothetical protein
LAASALTSAASSFYSASSTHELFLPAETHPPEPAAPAAARHGESIPIKAARKPGLDDLAQIAGHKGNDPDAVGGDHFVQSPGDRTTNQGADAKLRQTKRLLDRQVIRQKLLSFAHNLSSLGFNKVNLPNHIEDRCDSIVPGRKCRFHYPVSCLFFRKEVEHFPCQEWLAPQNGVKLFMRECL